MFRDRGHGMEPSPCLTFDDLRTSINAAALTRQDIAEDAPLVSTRFGRTARADRPSTGGRGRSVRLLVRQPRQET